MPRAYLEGRLSEAQACATSAGRLGEGGGLPSYPHPRRLPWFWMMPTASMGLSTPCAIYQARFAKYLESRGLKKPGDGKIWAFIGDGEADEPEVLGHHQHRQPRGVGQPWWWWSTATCSASTARCAATARSFRSWTWRALPRVPTGMSSRLIWGERLGTPFLPVMSTVFCRSGWSRRWTGIIRCTRSRRATRCASTGWSTRPKLRELMKTLTDEEGALHQARRPRPSEDLRRGSSRRRKCAASPAPCC